MFTFFIKALIAGVIVAFVSTYGARLTRIGSIVAVLPLITILTLSIMIHDGKADAHVARLAYNIGLMTVGTALYPLSFYFLVDRFGVSSIAALMLSLIPPVLAYAAIFPWLKS